MNRNDWRSLTLLTTEEKRASIVGFEKYAMGAWSICIGTDKVVYLKHLTCTHLHDDGPAMYDDEVNVTKSCFGCNNLIPQQIMDVMSLCKSI